MITFTGTKLYTSANGTKSVVVESGECEIVETVADAKHIYHIQIGDVDGWANSKDIERGTRKVKEGVYLIVRSEPSVVGDIETALREGTEVEVTEEKGAWSKIKKGWVMTKYLD